jgi:hypothetical protein
MAQPVKVSTPNQEYVLELTVDPAWLNHPDRVYPVTIDPTITHDTQAQFATGSLNRLKDTGADDTNPQLETYYQEVAADPYTVGLWHFNETEGNALDSSGNNNTGTPTGTTIVDGMFGKARSFNGSSDYIQLTNIPFTGNANFTIEAWVKTSSTGTRKDIVSFGTSTINNALFLYINSSNQLQFDLTNAGGPVSSQTITDGKWHHVAAVNQNGLIHLYVDGSGTGNITAMSPNITNTVNNYNIGRSYIASNYFNGQIDDVRISNTARSDSEIKAAAQRRPSAVYTSPVIDTNVMPSWNSLSWTPTGVATGDGETASSSAGLVAQWNFNETSGNTAASGGSCGAACNGTLTNFADTTGQDVAASSGWTSTHRRWGTGALMLDGVNDYVSVADSVSLRGMSALTIEAWIFKGTKEIKVVGKWSPSNQYILRETSGVMQFYTYTNSQIGGNYSFGALPGWHYYVATYNGSIMKLYRDGIQDSVTYNQSGSINNSAGTTLYIGSEYDATVPQDGIMDVVRIYNRALTSTEILSNYNASRLDFQTRSGPSQVPDGTWEEWKPSTAETSIDNFNDPESSWVIEQLPPISGDNLNTGTGNDGAVTVSDNTNLNTTNLISGRSCADGGDAVSYSITTNVSSGANSVTLSTTPSAGCISVGDEFLIINLQGTSGNNANVGQYEIHAISGINGAVISFTDNTLTNSYDGTTQKIMFQRVPNYSNMTINSGQTLNVNSWNGTSGGVLFFRVSGVLTNNGAINLNGLGFRGGIGTIPWGSNVDGQQGESLAPPVNSNSANVGGGGAGQSNFTNYNDSSGGGGAGFSANGTNGATRGVGGATTAGSGGNSYGFNNSTMLYLGSGGGASGGSDGGCGNVRGSNGGRGGGLLYLHAGTITSTGLITANGTAGENTPGGCSGGGGGGSGGMTVINTDTWSGSVTVNGAGGGAGAPNGGSGGTGASGRKIVYYRSSNNYPYYYLSSTTSSNIKQEGERALQLTLASAVDDSSTVGLWHLDETGGTGAYLKDSSGNGNHGTPTGTTLVEGISGKARSFNGTSDELNMGNGSSLSNPYITLEAWIKTPSPTTNFQMIITKSDATDNGYGFRFYSNTGRLQAIFAGTTPSNLIGNTVLSANTWYHVATTYDGTTCRIYINGVQDNFVAMTGSISSNSIDVRIGSRSDGYNFNGTIDGVRVSSVARSAEEIMESYRMGRDHRIARTITATDLSTATRIPFWFASDALGSPLEFSYSESAFAQGEPDANTVGLWRLEESAGSGAYLKDSSGNGNHGTPNGSTFTQGKIGKGRRFSVASNEAVTFPNINVGTNYTISTWILFPIPYSANWRTLYANNGGSYHYALVQSGGNALGVYNGSFFSCGFDVSTVSSGWHQLTSVVNSATSHTQFYLDGLPICQSSTQIVNQNIGIIGNCSTSCAQGMGTVMDEFSISLIARTPEEIRQAYELGKRSHVVTVDFKAKLDSGNLIANSNDLSFTIDETAYGSSAKANHLFVGDKLIVKENYDGIEYLAQGEVSTVNSSTGAVTVSAWDSGSTFPTSGFTANATVFKWQQEYMDLSGSLPSHRNAVTHLGYRLLDGSQGRTIWLDDLRYTGSYLADPAGSNITSNLARYFQYRTILTSSDPAVSAGFSSVSLDFDPINLLAPTPCQASLNYQTNTLDLSWTDTNTNESGYAIERKVDAGEFTSFQTLVGDSTSRNDATITQGHQYTYRIRTYLSNEPNIYSDYCTTNAVGFNQGSFTFGGGLKLDGIRIY